MDQVGTTTPQHKHLAIWLGPAILLLVLALSTMLLSVTAIDRAWIRGPDINLQFGEWHVIARTSTRPECIPIPPQQCFISFPVAAAARPPIYAVWVGHIRQLPSLGEPVTISNGRYVLYRAID